ncbi:MAG: nucleotidyl transferase AbiEii/AbiGii toxin family protein [Oligoflexus sp.]
MVSEDYKDQVSLVLEALPIVAAQKVFALKGGTALNIFYSNLPRLSVDIDLCYIMAKDRRESFREMHSALAEISNQLSKSLGCRVIPTKPLHTLKESRLLVERDSVKIKIEPNYIIRGTVFPPEQRTTTNKVEEIFQRSIKMNCLSIEDLLGGKFCAALDRQHPRDLFDVHQFFENISFSSKIKSAFIFYLLSHNRPIEEVLNPNQKNISELYQSEFRGMSFEEVGVETLHKRLWDLKKLLLEALTDQDKKFLISFYSQEPAWRLYEQEEVKNHPSIKWKLHNISQMTTNKKSQSKEKLEQLLSI